MPDTIAPVTFIAGERYVVRSNDGREFSVWDAAVFNGVMEHLHEELNGAMYSKQDDRGNWWNTLSALPDLGLTAARAPSGGSANAQSPGAGTASADLSALAGPLERIAAALEALVGFQMERALTAVSDGDYPEPQGIGSRDEEPDDV
jgi:hypothetical protein